MGLKKRRALYGTLTLFLASIYAASLFAADNMARAEDPAPLFYVESVFGAEGRQIAVPIKYEDIAGMEGVQFVLTYDPDILEPVDVIPDSSLPLLSAGDDLTFQFDLEYSSISIQVASAWVGTDGVNEFYPPSTGEFCRVVFNMLQGGLSGAPVVTALSLGDLVVSVVETIGGKDTPVELDTCATADGSVEVYEVLYGDVTGDGSVLPVDARTAFLIYMEQIDYSSWQYLTADVDGSNEVLPVDARLIFMYYMGLIDKFPVESIN